MGDHYSEGCNNAIRNNLAQLLTSAESFVKAMRWEDDARRAEANKRGIERQLFPNLSPDQKKIVDLLTSTNDLPTNVISVKTGISVGNVTALLFELEMMGVVRPLAGGMYHLLK